MVEMGKQNETDHLEGFPMSNTPFVGFWRSTQNVPSLEPRVNVGFQQGILEHFEGWPKCESLLTGLNSKHVQTQYKTDASYCAKH